MFGALIVPNLLVVPLTFLQLLMISLVLYGFICYLIKVRFEPLLSNFSLLLKPNYSKPLSVCEQIMELNLSLKLFFFNNGIIHLTIVPYTPQQNGQVERKHRLILNVLVPFICKLLFCAFLGWMYKIAVYLINRTPTQILNGKTPFEILFKSHQIILTYVFLGVSVFVLDKTSDKFNHR